MALLARAAELNRVPVTHDKGFLRMAVEGRASGRSFDGIAFAVQIRLDVGKAIEYLELIANVMTAEEMRNRVEYILSRS
jgi:hypothetical protein